MVEKVTNVMMLGLVLACCLVGISAADISTGMIAHWSLDETTGTSVTDRTGNNPGTVIGNASWVEGAIGGAISLDGTSACINCGSNEVFQVDDQVTMAAWVKPTADSGISGLRGIMMRGGSPNDAFALYYNPASGQLGFKTHGIGSAMTRHTTTVFDDGQWHHLVATYDGANKAIYIDNVLATSATTSGNLPKKSDARFFIGSGRDSDTGAIWFPGMLDEVRVYNRGLTEEDVEELYNHVPGDIDLTLASSPVPGNGATDVIRESVLTWEPGEYAGSHKVYFGDSLEHVNTATEASDVYQGEKALDDMKFDPGRLEFGKTYFWRVDEVNATPDKTVCKGNVWSFEVEPVAIELDPALMSVEASSEPVPVWGADNTINGSGLADDGTHGTDGASMWTSSYNPAGAWIEYTFDKAYKLYEMQIWNYNGVTELSGAGYSIKDVNVYTSTDGVAWTQVAGIDQFAQGTGMADYTGETFDMGLALASAVRIEAKNNHNVYGIAQFGLSEVRFSVIPNAAREMSPNDGTINVDPTDALLSWRAGREADIHQVYFSTDQQAVIDRTVAPVVTVEPNAVPALDLGQIYYWAVDEVNDFEVPSVWSSDVQSFSTVDSVVVDDIEFYKSEDGKWIWETWSDGYDIAANGALLGHGGDDMETGIVHGGSQSLPYYYGQDGAAVSEVTLPIDAQDWSKYGIKSLSLYFYGDANNVGGQLYVKINNGTPHNYQGAATDIQTAQWFPFTIDLTGVTIVNSLTIGVTGSSGMVIIDDIRLRSQASELSALEDPGTANLQAFYEFEGNYNDSSGKGNNGTPLVNAVVATDTARGQVLSLDGSSGVSVPIISVADELTIAAWLSPEVTTGSGANANSVFMSNGWEPNCVHTRIQNEAVNIGVNGLGNIGGATIVEPNEWVFVSYTVKHTATESVRAVYLNGVGEAVAIDAVDPEVGALTVYVGNGTIGAWDNNGTLQRFYVGLIDDVRIYDRALSLGEIAFLAGRTASAYKPL